MREFGSGFLVTCVRWGFDYKSLVMSFGCASLVGAFDYASLVVFLIAQFWCVVFGCMSLAKVWWWFWVERV